ncbi:MAG: HD domain-containing protein [Lachnospiraceae bacterium]|nr:HD domain-containing protein [Lachnospiraceae bacterium]
MKLIDLIELLKSANSVEEIDEHRDEIALLIPMVRIMFDYDQQNHAHQYDLWNHCLHTVINLPRNLEDGMLYLAALLHDIGKPDSQCKGTREDDTNMHYYGHPKRSMEIVRDEVIPYLLDMGEEILFSDIKRLIYYVEYHDDRVSVKLKHVRRHINMVELEEFQKLMVLQVADAKAHVMLPIIEERIRICTALAGEEGKELYERIRNGE